MSDEANVLLKDVLPQYLGDVFRKLVSGFNLCIDDGPLFADLEGNVEDYRLLFDELGFRLSHGNDGIYYFLPEKSVMTDPSKRSTVFMAILCDWLADKGRDPVSSILNDNFVIDELPHATDESLRDLMEQVKLDNHKQVSLHIKQLGRYGFVELSRDENTFRFRKPVERFLNIFIEAAERQKSKENVVEGVLNE